MNQDKLILLFQLRKTYFGFLFSVFIYFSLLLLILGKDVRPFNMSVFEEVLIFIASVIPALIFILKLKYKKFSKEIFLKLNLLNQVPLIIGFILSLLDKNYLYFLIMFPVFLLGVIFLIPTEKNIKGG